jgi:catechol 2,3-dioxygenase-like lactoylglutathione lyase family enzyme
MRWSFLVPNLPVRDIPAAQEWYRDVLGLGVNWIWEDNFGSVGQDSVELFLYETDELELKPWGVREISVRDRDGNLLRIGRGERRVTESTQYSVPAASRNEG